MRSLALLLALFATGCTSQILSTQEHVEAYYGSPISSAQQLYLTPSHQSISFWDSKIFAWTEQQTEHDNGDITHAFSNPYKDCTIEWTADSKGMIKSGNYRGTNC